VGRRAAAVTALLDAQRWPHAELATLTGFLRAALLRQASDEETLLFAQHASAAPVVDLSADHGRLYALTERLERTGTCRGSAAELRRVLEQLMAALQRHCAREERVLAELSATDDEVPAVAGLTDAERCDVTAVPALIELDVLPAEVAVQACIERVLRLRPGQRAVIRSHDRTQVHEICAWLHDFDPARFGFDRTRAGDGSLQLEVSCRKPN
jgi:hypothetical protein